MGPGNDLPIDMAHPAVREYIALTRFVHYSHTHLSKYFILCSTFSYRLQVLTPLSLLINIASIVICSTVIKPNLREVSREYVPTSITPKTAMIGVYIAFIWIAQLGYCVLLVLVRKAETKVRWFEM